MVEEGLNIVFWTLKDRFFMTALEAPHYNLTCPDRQDIGQGSQWKLISATCPKQSNLDGL